MDQSELEYNTCQDDVQQSDEFNFAHDHHKNQMKDLSATLLAKWLQQGNPKVKSVGWSTGKSRLERKG
jgi:hypothetical protein